MWLSHGVFWFYPWVLLWLCCFESCTLRGHLLWVVRKTVAHYQSLFVSHCSVVLGSDALLLVYVVGHANLSWSWIFFLGFIYFLSYLNFLECEILKGRNLVLFPFLSSRSRTVLDIFPVFKQASEGPKSWLCKHRDILTWPFLHPWPLQPVTKHIVWSLSEPWLYLPVSCLWSLYESPYNPFY